MGKGRKKEVKVGERKIQELEACHVQSKHACLKNVEAVEVKTKELTISDINVTDILGRRANTGITAFLDPVTCNPDDLFGEFTPEYLERYHVRKDVFDAMLLKAYEVVYSVPPQSEGLQYRLTQGRERLGLPSPSRIRLVGSNTFAPWIKTFPDSEDDFVNYLNNVSWNLQCANTQGYIDGYKPNPAVVSVYVQYGYIDKETEVCICESISIGNLELSPTIDYDPSTLPTETDSWGQIFVGSKVLGSGIIAAIAENMPDPDSTGGIQILFFAEEQIEVFRLNSCEEERSTNVTVIECGNGCNIGVDQNATVSLGRVERRVEI